MTHQPPRPRTHGLLDGRLCGRPVEVSVPRADPGGAGEAALTVTFRRHVPGRHVLAARPLAERSSGETARP